MQGVSPSQLNKSLFCRSWVVSCAREVLFHVWEKLWPILPPPSVPQISGSLQNHTEKKSLFVYGVSGSLRFVFLRPPSCQRWKCQNIKESHFSWSCLPWLEGAVPGILRRNLLLIFPAQPCRVEGWRRAKQSMWAAGCQQSLRSSWECVAVPLRKGSGMQSQGQREVVAICLQLFCAPKPRFAVCLVQMIKQNLHIHSLDHLNATVGFRDGLTQAPSASHLTQKLL